MDFAPLRWVTGTLTIWHFVVWAAFFVLCVWPAAQSSNAMPWPLRLWAAVIMLPLFYCWIGPIMGQIFGEKFDWSQLWPTGLAIGALLSTFYVVGLSGAAWSEKSVTLALVAVPVWLFAAMFFGLFISATSWLMPRIVDIGPLEMPTASWGVKLPPSP